MTRTAPPNGLTPTLWRAATFRARNVDDCHVAFAGVHDIELRAVRREQREARALFRAAPWRRPVASPYRSAPRRPSRCASRPRSAPLGDTAILPAPLPPVGITATTSSVFESTIVTDPSPSSCSHTSPLGRNATPTGPPFTGMTFTNAIGLRVEHHDPVVVAMRVIELVGARLNGQVVAAVEKEIDLLHHLARLDVVDHHARDVGVLEPDVELAAVVGQRHPVGEADVCGGASGGVGRRLGVRVKKGVSMRRPP